MARLELPKGQWIDVRDRLSNGHTEDRIGVAAAGISSDGESFKWNMAKYRTATAAIFILNWSEGIVDDMGKPVGWAAGKSFADRYALARRIDAQQFAHIYVAIEKHEASIEDAWVAEGNAIPADAPS